MHLLPILGCLLLGAGMVFALVPLILRLAQRPAFNRNREFHHTHKAPVPRLGGLALVGAVIAIELFILALFPERRARIPGRGVVIASSLAMFAVGFWDDLRPLGARKKLLAQILIAVCVHAAGLGIESFKLPFSNHIIELHTWGVLLTVLWLVGITNLINLIDGVDGLAGGIALMLMALLVYVGYQNGTFVFLSAGMTGALLAFLWFNFPPARIYLGDGGAYLIGFQIAIFSLVSSHKGTVFAALIAPLFVLALPIVDTTLAILRRGLRGLPLFRPDRRHIHHRLLATGMSRRKVVIWLYALTLLFLLMGFAAFWSRGHLVPVLLGLAVLILLLCAGRLNFSREWFAVGRTVGSSLAMRQEIQYALSLMTWLRFEGDRCASLEELYLDLVFAARRLGFTSVRLALADGERSWSEDVHCGRFKSFRQELQAGQSGLLELQAPVCLKPHHCPLLAQAAARAQPVECALAQDARLFDIMSELVAESWVKAAARCAPHPDSPLRYDSPLNAISRTPPGGLRPLLRRRFAQNAAAKTLPLGNDSPAAVAE